MTGSSACFGSCSLVGGKLATNKMTEKEIYNDEMSWVPLSGVQIALGGEETFTMEMVKIGNNVERY